MRFPRLSHLFHRRAKSDPELNRLASAPLATPATRPISTTYLAHTLIPSASSDLFDAYVPPAPLAFPAPPHHRSEHPHPRFYSAYAGPPPPGAADHSLVAVLTHRIRDLEGALADERATHEAALEANGAFAEDAAAMQAEILELRRGLFSALAGAAGPTPSSSVSVSGETGQLRVAELAAEHAALVGECDRLRRFVEAMLAAGEPKPVFESAYGALLEGVDPEAALVAAVRRAVAQPGNVWRRLLEPVTGVRTQAEYLAQVRCTLDARAQTQDWRRRAKFWKRAATEEGRHGETVTPSVSAISAVVDVLPRERRERVEEMLGRLDAGELPMRVGWIEGEREVEENVVLDPAVSEDELMYGPQSESMLTESSCADRSAMEALIDAGTNMEEPSTTAAPETHPPASSSSMVLPPVSSASTARISQSNLPPLASETFRASHSIKSLPSKGSRLSSGSITLGLQMLTVPTSTSSMALSARISASASASTQNSTKSRRRNAKIVAVPVVPAAVSRGSLFERALGASTTKITSRWSFFGPSRSTASSASAQSHNQDERAQVVEPTHEAAPCRNVSPAASSSTSDEIPSFDFSIETAGDDPAPQTPHRLSPSYESLPKALVDFSSSPEDDLVLVLHSDFSGSESAGHSPASPPTPSAGRDSAQTTPEKRSRLPVRLPGLKAFKRLSASINISRPVLVDTTNAATFAFSGGPAGARTGKADTGAGTRARAPSVAAGASPPRPSKIPMGRRVPKFGTSGGHGQA